MKELHQLLALCLMIVNDSTNFKAPELIADTNWMFQSRRPIREECYHKGEIAEFTIGIDKNENGVYLSFHNNEDEVIIKDIPTFIDYINIFRPYPNKWAKVRIQ